MFGWFRSDPKAKLRRAYEAKVKEAKDADKFGDRAKQADLFAEAEEIWTQIEALEAEAS